MAKDVKLRNAVYLNCPFLRWCKKLRHKLMMKRPQRSHHWSFSWHGTNHYPLSKSMAARCFCQLQQKCSYILRLTKTGLKFTVLWDNRKSLCDGALFQNGTTNETHLLANEEVFFVYLSNFCDLEKPHCWNSISYRNTFYSWISHKHFHLIGSEHIFHHSETFYLNSNTKFLSFNVNIYKFLEEKWFIPENLEFFKSCCMEEHQKFEKFSGSSPGKWRFHGEHNAKWVPEDSWKGTAGVVKLLQFTQWF